MDRWSEFFRIFLLSLKLKFDWIFHSTISNYRITSSVKLIFSQVIFLKIKILFIPHPSSSFFPRIKFVYEEKNKVEVEIPRNRNKAIVWSGKKVWLKIRLRLSSSLAKTPKRREIKFSVHLPALLRLFTLPLFFPLSLSISLFFREFQQWQRNLINSTLALSVFRQLPFKNL